MQFPPRLTHPSLNRVVLVGWALLTWLAIPAGLSAQTIPSSPPSLSPSALVTNSFTPQPPKPVFEEWIVLVINGKHCGFGCNITTETDTPTGPQFLTEHQEEFVVKRLNTTLKMTQSFKVTEDADGGVLSFEQNTAGLGSSITSTGVRDGDELVVTSRGETQRYKIPRLAALGPEKVRELTDAMPLTPGQTATFNTFESNYPQAVVVETDTVDGQDTRDVRGVTRSLWKITSMDSSEPGIATTSWVDDQGKDVEAVEVIPGVGKLHEYVTDRAECMKQPEGVEMFAPTLLRPQREIPSPHQQYQAVYRLTTANPDGHITLWNDGEQHILSSDNHSSVVEVTSAPIDPNEITWQLPHADTPELHAYLQPSSYLEVNAPEIQALAKEAVGNEKNPVLAAHAIEKFVRAYITKKDLNIGFASAEETAISREGDCTEHTVLCAALGRAAGLPTRCVVGLGYIPPGMDEPAVSNSVDNDTGIFGFHMWAEAWVGPGQWVPMDAALHGFDVGHIAITKTALEEINPLADLNAPILQMMENLKIELVKTVSNDDRPATGIVSTPGSTMP